MQKSIQKTTEGTEKYAENHTESDQKTTEEIESNQKSMQKSMQKIIELIAITPDITLSEIANRLGMTRNGVDKNIRKLKDQGIIRRVGPDKGGHWEIDEPLSD